MSQIFDEKGNVVPVTLVQAGPCFVTQIKTKERDGYEAVQIGFGEAKKINKPRAGHLKKVFNSSLVKENVAQEKQPAMPNLKFLKEFRTEKSKLNLGDEIKVDIFKEGDIVKASGLTIGRGFSGVVKRHNFAGGPKSHGQKHSLRAPGSIGATFPERVPKGRKMAGRYGGERVSIKNLKIVKIDAENNILAIKGAIPGKKGALIEIVGN